MSWSPPSLLSAKISQSNLVLMSAFFTSLAMHFSLLQTFYYLHSLEPPHFKSPYFPFLCPNDSPNTIIPVSLVILAVVAQSSDSSSQQLRLRPNFSLKFTQSYFFNFHYLILSARFAFSLNSHPVYYHPMLWFGPCHHAISSFFQTASSAKNLDHLHHHSYVILLSSLILKCIFTTAMFILFPRSSTIWSSMSVSLACLPFTSLKV